jgi:hypothetical protein
MNPKPRQTEAFREARRENGRRAAKARSLWKRGEADRALGIGVLRGGDPGCAHHWKIPPPSGPLAEGVCSRCKGKILLRNSTDHTGWKESNDAEGYYAFSVR